MNAQTESVTPVHQVRSFYDYVAGVQTDQLPLVRTDPIRVRGNPGKDSVTNRTRISDQLDQRKLSPIRHVDQTVFFEALHEARRRLGGVSKPVEGIQDQVFERRLGFLDDGQGVHEDRVLDLDVDTNRSTRALGDRHVFLQRRDLVHVVEVRIPESESLDLPDLFDLLQREVHREVIVVEPRLVGHEVRVRAVLWEDLGDVCGGVHPTLVHADENEVLGQSEVALDHIRSLVDRQTVGLDGVLRQGSRAPAMGDVQGSPSREIDPVIEIPAIRSPTAFRLKRQR